MTEEGQPHPLNARARPFRRWAGRAFGVVGLIVLGVVAGARLGQPVRQVEQKVAAPLRDVVKRASPLEQLPDLAAAACPAVVALYPPGFRGLPAQGVLITGDGVIVTTAPMPPQGRIDVALNDGRRLKATLQRSDPLSGVGLLKLDGLDFPSVPLADTDLPRLGSWGFALSSPAGHGCMVDPGAIASDFVAEGTVVDYYVRAHTGGVLPAPGTPFLSADGTVVALARGGGQADRYLPIDVVTTVIGYLMRDGDPAPNAYGMISEDLAPVLADRLGAVRGRGAVIVLVGNGSIAEKAGMRVGDVILSAGQSPISSSSELGRMLGGDRPIDLVLVRGGDPATRTITLPAARGPKA